MCPSKVNKSSIFAKTVFIVQFRLNVLLFVVLVFGFFCLVFFFFYRLSRVISKLCPLITHVLHDGIMVSPIGILCVFVVLFPKSLCVLLYHCFVFVSLVSLWLGWWKLVRQETQRKGFTWVKLCWRMASFTMVGSPFFSSHSDLFNRLFTVTYLKPNLPRCNLLVLLDVERASACLCLI